MKKKIIIHDQYGIKEKEIEYIPVRFIISILLTINEHSKKMHKKIRQSLKKEL